MPLVVAESGWRVVVLTHDHPPPHVHVAKQGQSGRVTIGRPAVEAPKAYPWGRGKATSLNARDWADAVALVAKHQARCLAVWEACHGPVG